MLELLLKYGVLSQHDSKKHLLIIYLVHLIPCSVIGELHRTTVYLRLRRCKIRLCTNDR